MMATLGARMREQEETRANRMQNVRKISREVDLMRAEAERLQCSGYLLSWRASIISAIESETPFELIKLDERYVRFLGEGGRINFSHPKHPLHHVWIEEMEPWLAENDLVAVFEDDYDEAKEQTWTAVWFEPKP